MNATAQLEMFEPDATDALKLLQSYMKDAECCCDLADRMELFGMAGAVVQAERQAAIATQSALHLAVFLDLLELSGVDQ